jgi:PAS domain S-box-containing protein
MNTSITLPQLRTYASFIKEHHLEELVQANLSELRALDVPLMRLFAHLPEADLVAMSTGTLAKLLSDFENDQAFETAAEDLRKWEADELPGLKKDDIEPEDLVLTHVAQKRALLTFLGSYTQDQQLTLAIVRALDDHYMRIQQAGFSLFTRLREQAASDAAFAQGERAQAMAAAEKFQIQSEEFQAQNEELQALNEELTAQAEELQSQQEELTSVYERLQKHNEQVESEVALRTRELAEQHAMLEGVLDNLPGAVGYCDADLVIRKVNQLYAAQLGKTPADFVDKHAREVFPEAFDMMEGSLHAVLKTGEPWREYGSPGLDAQGNETFQDFSVVPVRTADGSITGIMSLSIDVTERVRLERDLAKQSREVGVQKGLLERIVEQAPAGIAYLDRDLIVRWLNPEIVHLFGRPAEYYLDRPFFQNAKSEAKERFEPLMRGVITKKETVSLKGIHYPVTDDQGNERDTYWDFSYVPVFADDQEVEGVLLFTLEVSNAIEKDRLQQVQIDRLQQLDHMKDDFLGALSYQLSTPIHTIMGFASVLDEGAAGALQPQQTPYVKRILATSAVQLALVNDLLDLSRMSGEKFSLQRDGTQIVDVVLRALDTLAPLAEQQGQRIIRYLPERLPKLNADEQRLDQVLVNLLHGAIKLTPPGGLIRVEVKANPDHLLFEVQDSGFTLSDDEAARVFERFTQLRGTWLGLSITKAIVAAHGGTMGVRGMAGEGNTFWFTLPFTA